MKFCKNKIREEIINIFFYHTRVNVINTINSVENSEN